MDINILDLVVWIVMNVIFILIEKNNESDYTIGCLFSVLNIIYVIVFVYPVDLDWIDIFRKVNISL